MKNLEMFIKKYNSDFLNLAKIDPITIKKIRKAFKNYKRFERRYT